jgi:hypothetical protein
MLMNVMCFAFLYVSMLRVILSMARTEGGADIRGPASLGTNCA